MKSTVRRNDETYERAGSLEASDPERAEQLYRDILATEPSHTGAMLNLGRLRHLAGHVTEAAGFYEQAAKDLLFRTIALFNLGVAHYDLGATQKAREAWHRAIELDPDHADAHFNLALAYQEQGDELATMRHLRRYRECSGDTSWVLRNGAVVRT